MEAAEEENPSRSRSDEDSINFRPSPNFKHMKKYLKVHKNEETMIEANSSSGEENTLIHNQSPEVNNASVATAAAQPPLPPDPPPPDTPPMIINVKQEIEDSEYTCGTTETSPDLELSGEPTAAAATIKVDHSEENTGVTMCRNFARGTCKKGAACIFAHELILSQLPGVYTFCRNFQNSVCSFPKCKFVHATVFEKEHFFRTGYLPPHTIAHLKEASVQAPPPPPQSEEASAGLPPIYSNTAATTSIPCVPPAVVQYISTEQGDPNIFNNLPPTTTSITSPKRTWSEIDEVSNSTGLLDSSEPLAKKCKNCDNNKLRYHFASLSCSCSEHGVKEQLMKAKVEKCTRTNKELLQKIAQVKKKNSLRASLFRVFFGFDGSHLSADKELSLVDNDNSDWTSVLGKILRTAELGLPPDAS